MCWGGSQELGTQFHVLNEQGYKNFERGIYIYAKTNNYETAGKCKIDGIKKKEIGRCREVIFVEIVEFDPGLKW